MKNYVYSRKMEEFINNDNNCIKELIGESKMMRGFIDEIACKGSDRDLSLLKYNKTMSETGEFLEKFKNEFQILIERLELEKMKNEL